jgi:hypothetical protein
MFRSNEKFLFHGIKKEKKEYEKNILQNSFASEFILSQKVLQKKSFFVTKKYFANATTSSE